MFQLLLSPASKYLFGATKSGVFLYFVKYRLYSKLTS